MLLLCLGSSLSAQKVSVLYDGDFDFGTLKTFDFSPATYKRGTQFKRQPYLRKSLEKHLAEKGVAKSDLPVDAIVDVLVSQDKSISVSRNPQAISRNRASAAVRNRTVKAVPANTIQEEVRGKLVINITDRASKDIVWTGIWQGEADPDMKAEKRKKKVEKALKKMFKKYPDPGS